MAYLPLSTANLPDPAIDPAQGENPEDYFGTLLWTGDGTSNQSVTGLNFQPDLVFSKGRNIAYGGAIFDVVRGSNAALFTNVTNAETTTDANWNTLTFQSGGFNTGSGVGFNNNTSTFVAWNWKAGTSFSNDASATSIGTVDSNGSVSTESGFSIVRFNSGASGTQSFKHGLTQRPDLCIFKEKDSGGSGDHWVVWEGVALNAAQSYGYFNLTNNFANDASQWSNTAPTDSIFTYNSGYSFSTSQEMIAYCFHSVDSYSKISSYVGNGSSDGVFVYTGFRPSWLMVKKTDGSGVDGWTIVDNKRDTFNVMDQRIQAQASDAEGGDVDLVDFLSNGFKIRYNGQMNNQSGTTYIYLCFAEQPFKFSNAR